MKATPRGSVGIGGGRKSKTYPVLQSSPVFHPPITNPNEEKHAFEAGGEEGLMQLLRGAVRAGGLVVPTGELEKRIAEVYRLCLVGSDGKDLTIVSDFVAHCPRLAIRGCLWLGGLAAFPSQFDIENFRALTKGKAPAKHRLFDAMAKGFERAATPISQKERRRAIGPELADAARKLRVTLAKELRGKFAGWPHWRGADTSEQSHALCLDLVHQFPSLTLGDVHALEKHLARRRAFEAAVVIAARAFGVRTRDVRGNRQTRE